MEVPEGVRRKFFKPEEGIYVLDRKIRESVDFRRHHILRDEPFPEYGYPLLPKLRLYLFFERIPERRIEKDCRQLRAERVSGHWQGGVASPHLPHPVCADLP